MKSSLLFLFCAFALALSEDEIEVNAVGCPVDPTIHKIIEHDKYCNLFYSCVGGSRIEQGCPVSLVFNGKVQACDWPANVDCKGKGIYVPVPGSEEDEEEENPGGNNDPSQAPAICAKDDSDGVLIAHENCDRFYKCDRGIPVAIKCYPSLMYNSDLGICDWSFNVNCGDRIISPDSGEDVENHVEVVVVNKPNAHEICAADEKNELLVPHETCNRFYKCSFGKPVAFICPSQLLFNIEANVCDWAVNVQCGERPIVIDEDEDNSNAESEEVGTGGTGHSDPSQAPAICAKEKSDGVLIAHENCNQFYKCWQGNPVAQNCPLNLLYNAPLEICDWPQNVDCGSRLKTSRK